MVWCVVRGAWEVPGFTCLPPPLVCKPQGAGAVSLLASYIPASRALPGGPSKRGRVTLAQSTKPGSSANKIVFKGKKEKAAEFLGI